MKKLEEQSTGLFITRKQNEAVKADVYIKPHPNSLEADCSFLKSAMCTLEVYSAKYNDITQLSKADIIILKLLCPWKEILHITFDSGSSDSTISQDKSVASSSECRTSPTFSRNWFLDKANSKFRTYPKSRKTREQASILSSDEYEKRLLTQKDPTLSPQKVQGKSPTLPKKRYKSDDKAGTTILYKRKWKRYKTTVSMASGNEHENELIAQEPLEEIPGPSSTFPGRSPIVTRKRRGILQKPGNVSSNI